MVKAPKYYFPQLDSIRGLSFLAVYFFHSFHPEFTNSFWSKMIQYFYNNLILSIDVFFILSSFLLTWLGISEYKEKGNFSFINYFIRRALRIWPLYFLLMFFSFVLVPALATYFSVPVTLPPAYYYIFFISNFYLESHVYFLRFLWTLSVEEQFYLFWGICLLLFQKKLLACAVLLIMISVGYTIYAMQNNLDSYFNTLTYLFDFAVGIISAALLHKGGAVILFFKRMNVVSNSLFLLLLPSMFMLMFCLTYFTAGAFSNWLDVILRYLFIVYIGLFIIDQMVNENAILKLGKQRFLIYTGKISYGLYCFHGIVLSFGLFALQKTGMHLPIIIRIFVLLLVNYFISALSYQFIEKPFLNLKNRLRRI